ncbi:ras GEF [Sistotremastrum niveocremeum HHB9708]|uniref:Ras GEF n=1 Tax=Sistotremastrum niveocremeum HHB9708 TaxID=1314777 RepID=A0A164RGR4_9AGAM|nr:ras GEF [Sistotremastrum niveocremeum HHB9708]
MAALYNHIPTGPVDSFDDSQYQTFFCRALYDYQSTDASSLSFRRGDIIEVLTQLESGWWDGLLNDERGWFPSNYVIQVSDDEVEEQMNRLETPSSSSLERPVETDAGWLTDDTDFRQSNLADGIHQRPNATIHTSSSRSAEFWEPEVTSDGQIYYVNSITGQVSRDLPSDGDFEAHDPMLAASGLQKHSNVLHDSTPLSQWSNHPIANIGQQRRSTTPEPWIKRLADDGMSHYYENTETGQVRWDVPSESHPPSPRAHVDSVVDNEPRPLSVYSDDSEVNPLLPGDHPSVRKRSPDMITSDEDPNAPELIARRLQKALLPVQTGDFSDLADASHDAISRVCSASSDVELLHSRVDDVVHTIRRLLFRSGTLLSSSSVKMPHSKDDDTTYAHLKPFQRKVTATLSKLVLSARATRFNPSFLTSSALTRVEQDAIDLERAVSNFVYEVQRSQSIHSEKRRSIGALMSEEGAAGVGIGLVGGGSGGNWKGFGYLPIEEGPEVQLTSDLIDALQSQLTHLNQAIERITSAIRGSITQGPAVWQEVIFTVYDFTIRIADINVARHVDVDGLRQHHSASPSRTTDAKYMNTVKQARVLMRGLEYSAQCISDESAFLLMSSQMYASEAYTSVLACLAAIRQNAAAVVERLEHLYSIGHEQAELSSQSQGEYDYEGSINWRMSRMSIVDPFSTYSPADMARESLDLATESSTMIGTGDGHNGHEEDEDLVDLAHAISSSDRLAETRVRRVSPFDASEISYTEASSSTLNVPAFPSEQVYDAGNTIDQQVLHGNGDGDDLSMEEAVIPTTPPRRTNASKVQKFFGDEPPISWKAATETKPWYMKADYPPQDIILNPDGGVRAGTLSALIERLTDHEYRDASYIRTFLLTFKSFTTPDTVIDHIIARFNTPQPEGLTEEQHNQWKSQKQDIFRIRVFNVFKSIILDEELLEREELHIIERIRDFAQGIGDQVPGGAEPLVRLANRALTEGNVVLKMTATAGSNISPPVSILPKSKKPKLLDIDPLELARQLTLMESKLYNRIRVAECLRRAKDQKASEGTDNISAIIMTSNKVAGWINEQILIHDDARKRAAVIKHFISVADRCRALHNFSTMAAIVSGLNTPPISRLKRTWELVNARMTIQLQACEATLDSTKNFTNYRNTLAHTEPPCVPFLGVYLTMLVFINDGSKDILPPPAPPAPQPTGPLINFGKRQKAAEVIREIKQWQTKPYNLTQIGLIQNFIETSLNNLGSSTDLGEYFWNLSLEREPREREDEKMARLLQESGFL